MPASSVPEWTAQALAKELAAEGLVVTLAGSEAEAHNYGARYLATGSVEEVWLKEVSATEYESRMRIKLSVKEGRKILATREFSSSLSRRVAPLPSVPQELLEENLKDLLRPAVRLVRENVRP